MHDKKTWPRFSTQHPMPRTHDLSLFPDRFVFDFTNTWNDQSLGSGNVLRRWLGTHSNCHCHRYISLWLTAMTECAKERFVRLKERLSIEVRPKAFQPKCGCKSLSLNKYVKWDKDSESERERERESNVSNTAVGVVRITPKDLRPGPPTTFLPLFFSS